MLVVPASTRTTRDARRDATARRRVNDDAREMDALAVAKTAVEDDKEDIVGVTSTVVVAGTDEGRARTTGACVRWMRVCTKPRVRSFVRS